MLTLFKFIFFSRSDMNEDENKIEKHTLYPKL